MGRKLVATEGGRGWPGHPRGQFMLHTFRAVTGSESPTVETHVWDDETRGVFGIWPSEGLKLLQVDRLVGRSLWRCWSCKTDSAEQGWKKTGSGDRWSMWWALVSEKTNESVHYQVFFFFFLTGSNFFSVDFCCCEETSRLCESSQWVLITYTNTKGFCLYCCWVNSKKNMKIYVISSLGTKWIKLIENTESLTENVSQWYSTSSYEPLGLAENYNYV